MKPSKQAIERAAAAIDAAPSCANSLEVARLAIEAAMEPLEQVNPICGAGEPDWKLELRGYGLIRLEDE